MVNPLRVPEQPVIPRPWITDLVRIFFGHSFSSYILARPALLADSDLGSPCGKR
jgi:hypothetical protein